MIHWKVYPTAALKRQSIENILLHKLSAIDGFEWWPFKVGTYNAQANKAICLDYKYDTMAVLVLNGPHFFETTFKHWLQQQREPGESAVQFGQRFGQHPIREFYRNKFADIEQELHPIKMKSFYKFDITSPADISLPLCGFVSGATYLYTPGIITDSKAKEKKRRVGLSLHAKYGGHFAYRGVLIFPEVQLPVDFKEPEPVKTLCTSEEIEDAVNMISKHWSDNRYRDCGNPVARYSDLQLKYFNTLTQYRWQLLEHWFVNEFSHE